MNEIKCPHCGEVFKVDASGYADIVKQVRDAEFSRDLDERVKAVQREGEQALELERSRSTAALQKAESQRMLKKRMPNSSVRSIACVRSWSAKMTKPSLPSRRRAMLLKTI